MKKIFLSLFILLTFCFNAFSLEIKKDSTPVIYVVLVDATDGFTPETGITSPTVFYVKQGGSATIIVYPTWTEIDAVNMKGLYSLALPSYMTDTPGNLIVYVTKEGCRDFRKSIDIVSNLESDTYSQVSSVITYTNGQKDSGEYNGIEKLIRANR